MKKFSIKLCAIGLLLVFSFSSLGFTSSNVGANLNVNEEANYTQELIITEVNNSIESILGNYRTKADKEQKSFNGYVYEDSYAGIWYDEEQELNIGVTKEEDNKLSKIKYNLKEFSFNQLTELHSILVNVMNDYSIFSVGISQKNNKITVDLIDESQIKNIKSYLLQLPNFNKKLLDAIEFNVGKGIELDSGSAAGGRMALVWNPDTEEYINSGTITGIAIDNETGQHGVVTNHHVAEQGMRVERGSEYFGTTVGGPVFGISSKSQYGVVDASFIPFNNDAVWNINSSAYYWEGSYPNTYEPNNNVPITYKVAVESEIVEGAAVAKFGDTTGRTDGTITDIYGSITTNGVIFNNQIKHTAYTESGDSGSPLFIKDGDRFVLAGIHCSRAINFFGVVIGRYANKITDVQRELNITFIQPFNSLQSFTINNVFDLLEQNNDPVESFFEGISVIGNEYLGAGNFYSAKEALEYYVAYPQGEESIDGTHYCITLNQTGSSIGGYYKNANGNYSRSARTRLEDHYSTALNAYWNGDMENAIKYLGYAIHYIFDLGNTIYTTGATGSGAEAYLNYLFKEFDNPSKPDFHSTSTTIDVLYGNFSNSFKYVNSIATSSANGVIPGGTSFYDAINTVRTGTDQIIYYDPIIEWSLPQIEKYVAALLDQFYTDTELAETTPTHRSEAVILNGERYFLKNLKSGFYVDVKGWGTSTDTLVHQFSFSGDTNQMFIANYNDSTSADGGGYFNFTPVHAPAKRLSFKYGLFQSDGDCVLKNPDNSKQQRFRITYLEDGKYRVMTGASDYRKVFRSNSNASGSTAYDLRQMITELAFNPNSINHYWSFEKIEDLSGTASSFTQEFKSNVFYRIVATSSGTRTFNSTSSSLNFFEIGYRTGTGTITYTRTGNSTVSTQDFSTSITSGRIYYLKVNDKDAILPASNTNLTSNINIGTKDEIYVRLLPPSKRTYTFKSVKAIKFYNHAGALIPVIGTSQSGKMVYTITFNVNDTVYVRYQKVPGTSYIDFEMTS